MRTTLALLLLAFALPASAQPRRGGAIPDCERVGRRLGLSPEEVARMCAGGRELPPIPGVPLPPERGEPDPDAPFSCTERCQRYDDWGKCVYRTRCEVANACLKETACDRFDDWGKCLSEASKLTCRTRGRRRAEAACEARCERYDDWGKCLFQPACSWDGACMTRTSCSRYDDWGKCLFEGSTMTCPAFGRSGRPVSCTESCQRFDDWGKASTAPAARRTPSACARRGASASTTGTSAGARRRACTATRQPLDLTPPQPCYTPKV